MCETQILIPRHLLKLWLAFGRAVALTPPLRRRMEARLSTDLSDVRVHTGAIPALLCNTLNARALTLGNDILFADGEYNPNSAEGRWLLARQLVHVLQHRAAGNSMLSRRALEGASSTFVPVGEEDDACEAEADRLAVEIVNGGLQSEITPDCTGMIHGARRGRDALAISAARKRGTPPSVQEPVRHKKSFTRVL